tara:strand:- start:3 stop:248 length:246 start_codon:yes stop_codon:yes gene_type:complete
MSDILLADGFGGAFVGVGCQAHHEFAVYDYDKCIEILIGQGLSHAEADEHMSFNVTGAYVGESTPVFVRYMTLEQMEEEYG